MARELAHSLDRARLASFRDRFPGEVILPADAGYDQARRVWNGMIERRPAIVVRPTTVADVAAAIRFGREEDLPIAVRSGGHSLPGLSTCDDGIVIDMSRISGATVDAERRTARVNGGALLGELDDAAQVHGLACPVGVVSHTGVAGLTLGGGVGRLQRRLGLTIDNLRAVELVTADGRQVRASADENADLFWGLRGAGWNFGIATAFEFDLHPVGPNLTRGMFMHPIARVTDAFARFRDFAASASRDVTGLVTTFHALPESDFPPEVAGQPVVVFSVTHSGPPEKAEAAIAPLARFGEPVMASLQPMAYLEIQRMFDDAQGWGHRVYAKSVYVDSAPDALIETIGEQVAALPTAGSLSMGVLGGAIADVPEDATAYAGRNAAFEISADGAWDDPAGDVELMRWARGAIAAIEPFRTTGVYANSLADAGHDVAQQIYGDAKYERLRALKRTWDPDNVFRMNQNIQP